jgi:integrase
MTMQDQLNEAPAAKRVPWNKGKLTGAKLPLRPKHVWSIRTKLQIEGRARDLAMFNLAIDSKLRGCDVVAIRVEDVAAGGYTADRATVRQKKTGRPVRFELSDQTRQAVDDYLKATGKPWTYMLVPHDAVRPSATLFLEPTTLNLTPGLRAASASQAAASRLGASGSGRFGRSGRAANRKHRRCPDQRRLCFALHQIAGFVSFHGLAKKLLSA